MSFNDLPLEILLRMMELVPDIIPLLTSVSRNAYDMIYGSRNDEEYSKYFKMLITNTTKSDKDGMYVLNGLKHGTRIVHGDQLETLNYRLGKLHGLIAVMDKRLRISEFTYNNGILHGLSTIYIGDKIISGTFVNGHYFGTWEQKCKRETIYITYDKRYVTYTDAFGNIIAIGLSSANYNLSHKNFFIKPAKDGDITISNNTHIIQ